MIEVRGSAIDVAAVLAAVAGPGQGGVVLFLGAVRDHARGQGVQRLDYEAYGAMAQQELEALAAEARTRHGASHVAIVHRLGTLQVGELAVAIAVSAPHRKAAFVACEWLIDTLKQRVPIWKKEWYADGSQWIAEHP